MEILHVPLDRGLSLKLHGRLDAYWATHLGKELEGAIRSGNDRIVLDFQGIEFLSSAGIGVLLKYYKLLQSMKGSLTVVRPIPLVRNVFDLSGLTQVLLREDADLPPVSPEVRETRRAVERHGARCEVYDLQPSASLSCRVLGDAIAVLAEPAPGDDCFHLTFPADAFGVGVGALGSGYDDCRDRFGEFLSFGGATFYLPSNGTNVPDYDIMRKNFLPEVYVLNGLACRGSFSHFLRFEAAEKHATVPISSLLELLFEQNGDAACGFVMLAETQGLVGAWLRRSPVAGGQSGPFFEHPALRERLSFSVEPVFPHHLAWVAGVLSKRGNTALDGLLRPIADGHAIGGHLHALAMSYRHIPKGKLDFQETFSGIFDALDGDTLRGLLHLVNDDRPVIGRGESEFVRGVCWAGPIRSFGS
jgi:anti-anti-sigma factor